MQKGSVRVSDLVVDALFKKYGLPSDTPIAVSGGSMGGHGCIMYASKSRYRENICAIAAACPCFDMTDGMFTKDVLPRSYVLGVADQNCSLEEGLKNNSPIYQVDKLHDAPYYIACDGADELFDAGRMEEFAGMLSARGIDVTFRLMEGLTHGAFTPEVRDGMTRFVIEKCLEKG